MTKEKEGADMNTIAEIVQTKRGSWAEGRPFSNFHPIAAVATKLYCQMASLVQKGNGYRELCQRIILKIAPRLRIRPRLLAALACFILESSQAQRITPTATSEPTTIIAPSRAGDSIVLPSGFNDPIEPFNRAMWGFNKGFATWVVKPASKTYRRVVFKPVRTGLGKMG